MAKKEENTREFWNKSNDYYDLAEDKDSPMLGNPALTRLLGNVKPGMHILDVGCGEGSNLEDMNKHVKDLKCHGVDISKVAIEKAWKEKPNMEFKINDIEQLPYDDQQFDLTFSTYVFEHTTKPELVLSEMIRVTKTGGKIVIVCPNFGSGVYPSPVTPKVKHLIRTIIRDLGYILRKPKSLEWYPETPWLDAEEWKADYDTTILPYVYSLKALYPTSKCSSTWDADMKGSPLPIKMLRMPFKILGQLKLFHANGGGPILYFEVKKTKNISSKMKR